MASVTIVLSVATNILLSVTNLIGELILIYRCWLLWSRNYWVIILPSLISVASLVCNIVVAYILLSVNPNSPLVSPSDLATYSLPLGTNVIVTSLIAARIWYLSPRKARNVGSAQFPTRTGQAAIEIVVESGMLYLAAQLGFGIAPTLILIRVSLGFSNILEQNGPNLSGPPPSVLHPTSSTQVLVNTTSFTEPGRRLQVPAEMSVSEIKSKPSSRDLGSALSSVEDVASAVV
ncbi:hypothetical protein BGY98DRAFT_981592 [Russula aff. rugulosa BPL654]|nr:hypothetical protein BGY98DRAFT_981592 [Russula aff. rugulosa BPL654]